MYLVNTWLDISFAVKSLSQFMVELKRVHWIAKKTCFAILAWYNQVWDQICSRLWYKLDRLY